MRSSNAVEIAFGEANVEKNPRQIYQRPIEIYKGCAV